MPQDSGFHFSWQNLIMTVGLIFVMVGGYWTLAYMPIQTSIAELKQQVSILSARDDKHFSDDDNKFLTQKEHSEFKSNVQEYIKRIATDASELRKQMEERRSEAATRTDVQSALNTTRVEFLSEIKRLDQMNLDNMKRKEFEAWKSERDKTITSIQDRQNRFSEALDVMYSRITQQPPSYILKQP